MIEEYLKKLQDLQMENLNTLINIEIDKHYDTDNNYPWICVCVTCEGWHSNMMKIVPIDMKYLNVQMYERLYDDEVDNREHLETEYGKIVAFVEKLKEAYNS